MAEVSALREVNEDKSIYHKEFVFNKSNIITNLKSDIIRLLAKGLTSKVIGEKLTISSTTVDKHRRNMLLKTEKKNTGELIHFSLEQGWL